MRDQRKPLWVPVSQWAGSAFWMAAGAYMGPRLEFGPTSELLRSVLIAATGFTAWWWVVFFAWLLTRRRHPAGTSAPPAEPS